MDLDRLAVDLDRAPLGRSDAEQGEPDVGAAGTDQSGEADNLSGANLEVHIFERSRTAQPVDPQDRFAGHVPGSHEEVVDVPADHLAHHLLMARVGDEVGRDVPAVAEDGDPIGDPEHFVETVADEQHGDTPFAQPAHLVEQAVDLMR